MKAGEGRAVKGHDFNPQAPGQRGKPYEQLDQLLVDLLLRVRRVEEVYQKRFSRSVRKPRFLINLLSCHIAKVLNLDD
jgi:hypothetical protein